MKILFVFALLLVCGAGCGLVSLTNEEIIEESKKCTDAGLTVREVRREFDSTVMSIHCNTRIEE
jgi:hypothetical protein